jgi:hypothetical protein
MTGVFGHVKESRFSGGGFSAVVFEIPAVPYKSARGHTPSPSARGHTQSAQPHGDTHAGVS